MVFEDWSKEKAIEEFTDKRFDYHKGLYTNLAVLLESLDIETLKENYTLTILYNRMSRGTDDFEEGITAFLERII